MQFRIVSQMGREEIWADLRAKNPRGYGVSRNPLFFLVAGAGFEPATFGL